MPAKKEPDKIPDLLNPIFTDADAAREHLEAMRWPDGPVCPHCKESENVTRLENGSHRPGLIQCNACRQSFTVTVGTLFERSHIPLNKWLLAFHLIASSKKGISSHQLHRMLDVTYKTAWFMSHRVREAMKPGDRPKLGGEGRVVEADETFWGHKAGTPKRIGGGGSNKNAVMALVDREGAVRAFHIPDATAQTVQKVLDENAEKDSHLMTDDARHYRKAGRGFADHTTLNHTRDEYSDGKGGHTNTVESFFSIFKRGMIGTFHQVSTRHLQRYVTEFDFRANHRTVTDAEGLIRKLTDAERATAMLNGIEGRRLMYRRPNL